MLFFCSYTHNIWQEPKETHSRVSILTAFLLPGFHASRKDRKNFLYYSLFFVYCPRTAPLSLALNQGKPCSTQEWLSNGNWCRFSPCHLPETFSLCRTFISVLFICFRGSQVREVIRKAMTRHWDAPEWVASLLLLSQPFYFRNWLWVKAFDARENPGFQSVSGCIKMTPLFPWHKDPSGIHL